MTNRLRFLRHDLAVKFEKVALILWRRVPMRWRHTVVLWEIGSLTTDPGLWAEEVPGIRVDQLVQTIQSREGRRVARV